MKIQRAPRGTEKGIKGRPKAPKGCPRDAQIGPTGYPPSQKKNFPQNRSKQIAPGREILFPEIARLVVFSMIRTTIRSNMFCDTLIN